MLVERLEATTPPDPNKPGSLVEVLGPTGAPRLLSSHKGVPRSPSVECVLPRLVSAR